MLCTPRSPGAGHALHTQVTRCMARSAHASHRAPVAHDCAQASHPTPGASRAPGARRASKSPVTRHPAQGARAHAPSTLLARASHPAHWTRTPALGSRTCKPPGARPVSQRTVTRHPAMGTRRPSPGTRHPAMGTRRTDCHPATGTRRTAPGYRRTVTQRSVPAKSPGDLHPSPGALSPGRTQRTAAECMHGMEYLHSTDGICTCTHPLHARQLTRRMHSRPPDTSTTGHPTHARQVTPENCPSPESFGEC